MTLLFFTGGRNGYFDALLSAQELHSALPLPALPSLYRPAPHSQACQGWTPLTPQLILCAAQRISTLHEQLLHQQYSCPLIYADPAPKATTAPKATPQAAPAAPNAAAPSTDDSQPSPERQEFCSAPMAGVSGATLSHSGSKGEVTTEVTPELSTEVTMGGAPEVGVSKNAKVTTGNGIQIATGIQTELQQLSGQVLQHAASLLKAQSSSGSDGVTSSRATEQLEHWHRTEMLTDFWPAVLLLLPTLAIYAPEISLQHFLSLLISRSSPDLMLISSSAPDTELSSASGSASEAAAAQVIAGCMEQPGFLEQSQLQQAWLQAIQQELLSVVTVLHSTTASSFESPESPHAQLGGTSKKKHRKSQGAAQADDEALNQGVSAAEGLMYKRCGRVPNPDLQTALTQTLQAVTPLLASAQTAASEAATEAVAEGDAAANDKHNSNLKAGSSAKKRKKADMQSSKAAQTSPMLRHVTGLLQHVALMPLAMLSSTHAASLAQTLLQTQLLLAQSVITCATAAAVDAKADDIALDLMVQAMVSSQQGITRCLKGSSDAAAAGLLLHAGPQLWPWLPAAMQLASHLQSLMLPSSTPDMPVANTPYTQESRTPLMSASELHSLPAGRRRGPASGSNDALCMLQSVSTSMLQEVSASVCCLAGYCLGVRFTAEAADADVVGFQTFVTGLANKLQVCFLVECYILHAALVHVMHC